MMVFLSVSVVMPVGAADIYVGPDEAETTIQGAVNNATPGDTIIVRDGTYNENVVVNKQLIIRSENGAASTTVHGGSSTHTFRVTVDDVDISGFTVTGAINNIIAGIYLCSVDHCTISDNNATGNYFGISLYSSSDNTLTNNTASNNRCTGIHLKDSCNNTLTNNTASNNWDKTVSGIGIRLYSSSNNNKITNNTANENKHYGISMYTSSSSNVITGNTANSNGAYGIHVYDLGTAVTSSTTTTLTTQRTLTIKKGTMTGISQKQRDRI